MKKVMQNKKTIKTKTLFEDWNVGFADEDEYTIFAEPDDTTPILDTSYIFPKNPTLYLLSILEKEKRNNVWISGPSGSGKSSLVRNLAAKLNSRFYEINGDEHKTTKDVFGRRLVQAGDMTFQYGIVAKWMKSGGILLLNEYDTFDSSVVNAFKSCLEFPRRLVLSDNDDEVVNGHPDCKLIVTCNTLGRGDDTGQFVNTQTQSIADLRRFDAFIEVDFIDEEQEKLMLAKMFDSLSEKTIANFVQVASRTRDAFKKGASDRALSTAELINWAENYTIFAAAHLSARISFLNSYPPVARQAVKEAINTTFGHEDREILENKEAAERANAKAKTT